MLEKLRGSFYWEPLSKWPKFKIINSMYLWLFIVPVLAKFMAEVDEKVILIIFEQKITLNLTLPFNLVAFYLAAVSFVLGNICIVLFFPRIFKENKGFGGFLAQGKQYGHLVDYLRDSTKSKEHIQTQISSTYDDAKSLKGDGFEFSDIYSDIYLKVSRHLSPQSPRLRTMVSCFYFFGFFLILAVFLENIWYVITEM